MSDSVNDQKMEKRAMDQYAKDFPDGPEPSSALTEIDGRVVRLYSVNGLLATYKDFYGDMCREVPAAV